MVLGDFQHKAANVLKSVVGGDTRFAEFQTHGLSHGTAQRFGELVASELTDPASRDVAHRLTVFLKESESQLRAGERLPLSTEILESSFGLDQQLERQQSQGGFTSLLASIGSLRRPTTPESVRKAFSRVSVKDARAWIKSHITETLTSKRQAAYREFQSTRLRATELAPTSWWFSSGKVSA